MTDKTAMQEFLELKSCSDARIQKMRTILLNIKKLSPKQLINLEKKDIIFILKKINEAPYTNWTKNDYKKIFKAFVRHQYKTTFIELMEDDNVKDAFKGLSKKKAFNHKKINTNTLITPEELEKLIRTAKSLKWKALLSFMYESAFRPCEIRELTWGDLKFDDSRKVCLVTIVCSPKTKEKREIPVKDCVVHLKRWRDEYQFPNRTNSDYVFPSQFKRNEKMGNGVIGQMLIRICEKAKIRKIFPYLFRHTRILEIQRKLPEKIAAKFAGHSVETSELYNHISDDDVTESMLEKIYTTEELSPEEENELKKELKQHKQKIDSLLQFESRAIKIEKANARVLNKLIQLASQGKISDKEFIELMDIYKK
jgi:integrase